MSNLIGCKIKTIVNEKMEYNTINCDLIVHSNGKLKPDNLLALEMKKSRASPSAKQSDRNRLIALTKSASQDIWPEDGRALPEYVCGYEIGYYMELNVTARSWVVERYELGEMIDKQLVEF